MTRLMTILGAAGISASLANAQGLEGLPSGLRGVIRPAQDAVFVPVTITVGQARLVVASMVQPASSTNAAFAANSRVRGGNTTEDSFISSTKSGSSEPATIKWTVVTFAVVATACLTHFL